MAAGEPTRSQDPREFFSDSEQQQIVQCVKEMEKLTSAEIRVRIERSCSGDPVLRCYSLLEQLGITETKGRTGVLIYMTTEDRKVAVYGDHAVDQVIGTDGWSSTCKKLQSGFESGDFVQAICETIEALAKTLSVQLPAQPVNPNELPDTPSFGE